MTEPPYLRATRTAYDAVAADYARLLRRALDAKPLDRGLLAAFAELLQHAGGGQVADLVCGPGRVTGYLHALGVPTFGIDLSPAMVEQARRAYARLRFDEGSMTALDLPDGELAGLVAWYSIIHTPTQELPAVFGEFHRVLRPGGYALLAFQAGTECVLLDRPYGHAVRLEAYRLDPEQVITDLRQAGLTMYATTLREPVAPETTAQAYLIARRRLE